MSDMARAALLLPILSTLQSIILTTFEDKTKMTQAVDPHLIESIADEGVPLSSNGAWDKYARLAPLQRYNRATELYKQGDEAQYIHLLTLGLVKLTRLGQNGQELIISVYAPTRLLGTASAILRKPHPVTAMTLTECHIHTMTVATFHELMMTDTDFSWLVQREQSRDAYEQIIHLTQLGCLSARRRLEILLCQFISMKGAHKFSSAISLALPVKLWEIAEIIAVTPEHLSRLLSVMQREGILLRENKRLIILSPQKLLPL